MARKKQKTDTQNTTNQPSETHENIETNEDDTEWVKLPFTNDDINEDIRVNMNNNTDNFAPIPHNDTFTEEDFKLSLNEMKTESDFSYTEVDFNENGGEEENEQKPGTKRKHTKAENIIEFSILGICAAVALVCIIMLVKNIYGKVRSREIYDNTDFDRFVLGEDDSTSGEYSFNHPMPLTLKAGDGAMLTLYQRINNENVSDNTTSTAYSEKLSAMRASLTALKAKNPDVYGWIYVENTKIDYPLMQAKDNSYYLTHAYTGESLPTGSIFIDHNCTSPISDNLNAVIYGHNIVSGYMFHDVTKFLNADFFAKNKIYVYTMDGVFIYQPFSIYETSEKYFYYRTNFHSVSDFVSFAADVKSKSSIKSDLTITENDKMVTLSTCTNSAVNRYALHAKLIETIK